MLFYIIAPECCIRYITPGCCMSCITSGCCISFITPACCSSSITPRILYFIYHNRPPPALILHCIYYPRLQYFIYDPWYCISFITPGCCISFIAPRMPYFIYHPRVLYLIYYTLKRVPGLILAAPNKSIVYSPCL